MKIPLAVPLGVGQEQNERVVDHWQTASAVEDILAQNCHIRLSVTAPKDECPEITPEILTTTDSTMYSNMYALLLSWFTYISEVNASLKCRVLEGENTLEILEAETKRLIRERHAETKKIGVEELRDQLMLNVEYQEALHLLQRYKQGRIIVEAKMESIERSMRVVSRQVEIRKLDYIQHNIANGIPNRRIELGVTPERTGVRSRP